MNFHNIHDLRGWHLVDATLEFPKVYRIIISRRTAHGAEIRHGYAKQTVITTAREFGYLSAPNGRTLPTLPV